MIKSSTYIRNITPLQQAKLKTVAMAQKLKTTPDVLFFVLDQYLEQQQQIERLNRIISYKQKKIDNLENNN